MDSILRYLLNSNDQAERERLLSDLILTQASPLVRKVLRQKLAFNVSQSGTNPSNPDAEDLFQEITATLIKRLNKLIHDPDKYAITNFRQFVRTLAINACREYLRKKSPERMRLKNNLRDLFYRHPDFKIWRQNNLGSICGYSEWEGMPHSLPSSERLKQIRENPDFLREAIFRDKNIQRLSISKVVAEFFKWLGGPIEFETFVELYAGLTGIHFQQVESIEQQGAKWDRRIAGSTISSDKLLESREKLILLWNEIKQLPPEQRDTVCLGYVDKDCEDIVNLLVNAKIITFPQLASDLGMSIEELMNLWKQIPMDSATLANYLGATRSQVNKWRFQALKKLRKRLASKK
jgi:RNA polymerase sigma factor (sigma-70 family)